MTRTGLKFIVVGFMSTAIDFFFYYLISIKIDITISKFISMMISSVFAFFLNKKWTFDNSEKRMLGYLIKYYIVLALNICINLAVNRFVFYKCRDGLAFGEKNSKIIAFIIATGIAMILNYSLQKFWVFKKEEI